MPIYNIKKVPTHLSAQPSSGGGKKVRKNYQLNFKSDKTLSNWRKSLLAIHLELRLLIWNCSRLGCPNTFNLTMVFFFLQFS